MADLSVLAKRDYLDRVNRAVDHIMGHLAGPLQLDVVAQVAAFSPFHFHRIFRAVMGETVHDFVKRVRLERAVLLMSRADPPPLTEVALACGLGSSSDFTRSFRGHFGVPPSAFDVEAFRRGRRDEMIASLEGGHALARLPEGANPDGFEVRLRRLPARRVFYRRVLRPYEGTRAAEATAEMLAWARGRGLAGGQWLGYQWDNPEIVPLDLCRYDVGVEVPASAAATDEVSELALPPMQIAEVEIAGSIDLEIRALDWLFTTWLPGSGYVPDDQPMFEAWIGEPFAHGDAHFEIRVQLPVVAARPATRGARRPRRPSRKAGA